MKEWPKEWTQLLEIFLPKKSNLMQYQNYHTISLISHPRKMMLRDMLNRLKTKAEELLAEAGFRPGRSTAVQIFSSRVIIEKHLQHQRDLFHSIIDFKKAFDRVWHAGLGQALRSFSIEKRLVQANQALRENSSSAVLLNSQLGEFFKTTVGVLQGCLLSQILLTCS